MRVGSRQGAMAAHWRWVARWLQCSIRYEDSSYSFGTTRGTHFTNHGLQRRLYQVGGCGILHSNMADDGELLWPTFGFKVGTGSLPACTSHSYAGSLAPSGGGNRARWLRKVWRVPQLVGENMSTIGRYI
jgi:hypothetical protein